MTSTTFLRRSVAVLASAGTTAALALLPSASAHASVAGLYAAAGNAGASYTGTGGGTCTLTSGSSSTESPVKHFSKGTKSASADLNATFTNSLDSSDQVQVKGHVDSTLTLHKKHNDLTYYQLTVGGTVSINHTTTGSDCRGEGDVLGEAQVTFTEHKKGWFYFTRTTKQAHSLVEFVLINVKTDQVVSLDVFQGDHSSTTSRALLKPGTYEIEQNEAGITAGGVGVFAKAGPKSTKVKQTITLTGQFKPIKH